MIRPAEKLEGRSLLVADLISKLGRFRTIQKRRNSEQSTTDGFCKNDKVDFRLSGKVIAPFQRVQYSDAKHAALDDISNYSPSVDKWVSGTFSLIPF